MRYPTITRNNDFRRAYSKGKSFVGYSLVVYVMKNRNAGTRVGITSSKKIGNAVQRNRARRVIRAAVDAVVPKEGLGNVDLILVARSSTAGQKSQQVAAVLKKLLKKANLLPDAPAAASQQAAPTSHTCPTPEEAPGTVPAHTPLTTSAPEPETKPEPLLNNGDADR